MIIAASERVHRNPKYWKYPDTFNPKNFLDENGKFQPAKEGYMPFVIGKFWNLI